jgi:hypothetical protein
MQDVVGPAFIDDSREEQKDSLVDQDELATAMNDLEAPI